MRKRRRFTPEFKAKVVPDVSRAGGEDFEAVVIKYQHWHCQEPTSCLRYCQNRE